MAIGYAAFGWIIKNLSDSACASNTCRIYKNIEPTYELLIFYPLGRCVMQPRLGIIYLLIADALLP